MKKAPLLVCHLRLNAKHKHCAANDSLIASLKKAVPPLSMAHEYFFLGTDCLFPLTDSEKSGSSLLLSIRHLLLSIILCVALSQRSVCLCHIGQQQRRTASVHPLLSG